MIKYLCLAASLILTSATAVHACQAPIEAMTGEQSYRQITPGSYKSWDTENISVGLVYIIEKRRKDRDVPESMWSEKEKKPFVKIEYELVENISGDFIPDEKTWVPEIPKEAAEDELQIKSSPRNFAFWDRRSLNSPVVYGYNGGSMCGPDPTNTVLSGQHYLHFKSKGRTIGMEIVSGHDDTFVDDWRKIYSTAEETKVKRRPKNYFTDIDGYQEFELSKCLTADEFDVVRYSRQSSDKVDLDDLTAAEVFNNVSYYNSAKEDLRVLDFLAYQERVKGRDWTCKPFTRYLVLDKISRPPPRIEHSYNATPPRHRYIEIENGQIDTKNILSNITILHGENGNTKVNVNQVKSWIEFGRVQ